MMSYTINPSLSSCTVSCSCSKSPSHTHIVLTGRQTESILHLSLLFSLHVTDKQWPVVLKLWFRDSSGPCEVVLCGSKPKKRKGSIFDLILFTKRTTEAFLYLQIMYFGSDCFLIA